MATTIMTIDGKTQRTKDFYGKTGMYIGIGRTTDWTSEPTPDDALTTQEEIEELQAIKLIDTVKYVRAQTGGEITFNGSEWTEVSGTEQTYTADTISFAATNAIADSGAGLPVFDVGTKIKIIGDSVATNDGIYTVATSTTSAITVDETSISTVAAGTDFTVKSDLYTNDVHHLYYEAILAYDNGTPDTLPLITYRQVGLLENPIDTSEAICTGSVYTSLSSTAEFPQGVLHYVDNRSPVIRTISQKESIQLIIEF